MYTSAHVDDEEFNDAMMLDGFIDSPPLSSLALPSDWALWFETLTSFSVHKCSPDSIKCSTGIVSRLGRVVWADRR